MDTPSVSIIIPVFNKGELTHQCLRALLKLPPTVPCEIIVVDNGSTDDTPQRLKEFGDRIRWWRRETNGGFAVACNEGAAAARSDLLLFLNNDTVPLEGWLEPLVAETRLNAGVVAVGPKLLFSNGLIQHAGVAFARETRNPFHPHFLLRGDDRRVNHRRELQAITGACLLIRRKWFERCGGFNEAYLNGYEDLDLCLHIRGQGGGIVYQPRSVLFHLESQTPGRKKHDDQNRARFFQRWGERLLSDEDAYYFEDDYRLLDRASDWPLDCRLVRLRSEAERRQWEVVARVQRAAARVDWQSVARLLSDTQAWPDDARLRRWAGLISSRQRLPSVAERHLQRSLQLEDNPDIRLRLKSPKTAPHSAENEAAAGWMQLLIEGEERIHALEFPAASSAFKNALAQGAPPRLALPGWLQAARRTGCPEEIDRLEHACAQLPRTFIHFETAAEPAGAPATEKLTSIVILAHNQLEHTRRCLESIAEFTSQPCELILIDNASTDGTREWLAQYASTHPQARVIHNAVNRGFAAGNNQGLALARGDFVLLLNNDTVVTTGWLESMLAVFDRHAATGMVGPRSNRVVGPQLIPHPGYRELAELPGFAAEWARRHTGHSTPVPRLIGFCLLLKREVVKTLGGLDPRFGSGNFEDDDYCLRAGFAGFELRIADDAFVHHVGGQTFLAARIDYREAMLNNWRLFKQKWGMPAEAPIEAGYRTPATLPPNVSLHVPLPSPSGLAETSPRSASPPSPDCAQKGSLRLALELRESGNLAEAWAQTLAALETRPFHPEAFLLLARIAEDGGDGVSARRCAQHALQLAPGFKPARKFLKRKLRSNSKPAWLVLPPGIAPSPHQPQPTPCAPRLSVCLITKNEEPFLDQCLSSLRGMADQLIVVDTGSTDRTVAIAAEHGAEVHSFKWTDDFSAARNAALEHATGDWVLALDADEELPAASHEALRQLMQTRQALAWRLPVQDAARPEEGCSYVPRLFRNAPGLFYVGRIHEQVFGSLEALRLDWGLENRLGNASLLHHGYRPEVVAQRGKIERNLRLLELALEESPADANLRMNYGLELARSGKLLNALAQYDRALALLSAAPPASVTPELRETLLTQFTTHLITARRFEDLPRVLQSPLARAGGLTASLHFALGLAHFELRQFREAADQMRQCLAKRDHPALAPIHPEIRRAGPRHCLALALEQLGLADQAAEQFRLATAEDPQSLPPRSDYARFLAAQARATEALNLYFDLATENPNRLDLWFQGGQVALSQPEYLEVALDWTAEALRHISLETDEPLAPRLLQQRAEALTLAGQCDSALPFWQRLQPHAQPACLAALVLCETSVDSNRYLPPAQLEPAVSREFIAWYQRLSRFQAHGTMQELIAHSSNLNSVLPLAGRLLSAAIAETEAAHPVLAPAPGDLQSALRP